MTEEEYKALAAAEPVEFRRLQQQWHAEDRRDQRQMQMSGQVSGVKNSWTVEKPNVRL